MRTLLRHFARAREAEEPKMAAFRWQSFQLNLLQPQTALMPESGLIYADARVMRRAYAARRANAIVSHDIIARTSLIMPATSCFFSTAIPTASAGRIRRGRFI